MPKAILAFLLATTVLAAVACGGTGESEGTKLYNAYRSTEDRRDVAESHLRQAFSDVATAASKRDREAVFAAARRGQEAADEIDGLLGAEIEAAQGLSGIADLAAEARKLERGLEQTRRSLGLLARGFEIALDDPFLERRGDEVNKLVSRASALAVKGELAVRRADRALALALGLEPRIDQIFTNPTATG